MVYLGIDYGLERTGLALSNPEGTIAFPLCQLTLAGFGARKFLLDEIAALARQHNAGAIVMGLPLLENGEESETTRQIRNAAKKIRRRSGLPLHFMPELLSTFEAMQDLREVGRSRKSVKDILDQQAACRILQSFLDRPRREP